jgi:hypothetical protein
MIAMLCNWFRLLGEELSQKYETHKSAFKRKGKQPKQDISRRSGGHIMISYQWGHQEMLKIIRDRVKAHGYKVKHVLLSIKVEIE